MVAVADGVTPEEAAAAYARLAGQAHGMTPPAPEAPAGETLPEKVARLGKEVSTQKYTIARLEADLTKKDGILDGKLQQIAELSAKVDALSGVTIESRSRETIKALQKTELGMQRTIFNHEATLSKQRVLVENLRREIESLRRLAGPEATRVAAAHEPDEVFWADVEAVETARSLGIAGA